MVSLMITKIARDWYSLLWLFESHLIKKTLLFQDVDCLICFGSHASIECPERSKQHCPDCHVLVRHCSDHTPVCGSKTWIYNRFAGLYAKVPMERCIVSIDSPFRFLLDGCWRKGTDGMSIYSSETGAFFEFKSDNDLSLLSNKFVGIRIAIVVKESNKFVEKLLLLTSKSQMIGVVHVDNDFNRNHIDRNTSLVLCVSSDTPVIKINVFPKNKPAREYSVRYNGETKKFNIPDGLRTDLNLGLMCLVMRPYSHSTLNWIAGRKSVHKVCNWWNTMLKNVCRKSKAKKS